MQNDLAHQDNDLCAYIHCRIDLSDNSTVCAWCAILSAMLLRVLCASPRVVPHPSL